MRRLYFKSLGIVLVGCLLFFSACNKLDELKRSFDFSRIDGMDGGGEWGVSLLDAKYTIGDLLDMTDKEDQYVEVAEDGSLSLVYSFNKDTLITSGEVMESMLGKEYVFSGDVTLPKAPPVIIPGFPIDLYDSILTTTGISYDQYALDSVMLRSGKITFILNHNCPLDVRVEMSSPNIREADGTGFTRVIEVDSQHHENVMDLSGCAFVLSDSILTMILHITCYPLVLEPLPDSIWLDFTVKLNEFAVRKISGKFAPVVIDTSMTETFDVGMLSDYVDGSLTLYDPQIDLYLYNSLPIKVDLDLNRLALKGSGYFCSLLSETPAKVTIPSATADFTKVDIPITHALTLSTKVSQFDFAGKATINPDGMSTPTLHVTDQEVVGMRAAVKVPMKRKVDDLSIRDTLDFGTDAIDMEDVVRNLVLRLKLENGLPLDVQVQVYFCDSSQNMRIVDSLFTNATSIAGGYDKPVTTSKYVEIKDISQINRILTADKAIVHAVMHTDGRQVQFSTSQYLRCAVSAKCNVDYNRVYKEFLDKDNDKNNNKPEK
ncbi:MAG: hypothetical protein J5792_06600 [Bacteroidales bacterium]|nr:hypothetical protein [Bacteroidales bacterium]